MRTKPGAGTRIVNKLPASFSFQHTDADDSTSHYSDNTKRDECKKKPKPFININRYQVLDISCGDIRLLPMFDSVILSYRKRNPLISVEVHSGAGMYSTQNKSKADIELLPGRLVNTYRRQKIIVPVDTSIITDADTDHILSPVLDMLKYRNRLWGIPLYAGGNFLSCRESVYRRYSDLLSKNHSIHDVLTCIENEAKRVHPGNYAYNVHHFMSLILAECTDMNSCHDAVRIFQQQDIHNLLVRMRNLCADPGIKSYIPGQAMDTPFEKFSFLAQNSGLLLPRLENNASLHILNYSEQYRSSVLFAPYCITVSAACIHQMEAWEIIRSMLTPDILNTAAETVQEIPISDNATVREKFQTRVGKENADTFFRALKRPSALYSQTSESLQLYLNEILLYEIYRYCTGMNSYESMIERLKKKTNVFIGIDRNI